MDSFLLHRDPYRPRAFAASSSARYGPFPSYPLPFQLYRLLPRPSLPYGVDPWRSLPLPSRDPPPPPPSYYTRGLNRPALPLRSSLDGLGPFRTQPAFPRGFARSAFAAPTPLRRGGVGLLKSSPLASQSLRPRRKSFKQIGVGKAVNTTVQRRKNAVAVDSRQGRVKVSIEALAEEARELHALWRTGVDHTPSKSSWSIVVEKQKPEAFTSEAGKIAKRDGKPSRAESKKARKKNLSRQENKTVGWELVDGKSWESVANAEATLETNQWLMAGQPARDVGGDSGWEWSIEKGKLDVPPMRMTDEETQEERSVGVQRQACNSVSEFLGNFSEDEDSESEFFSESDEEIDGEQKPAGRTVKGREESAFEFFSKLLEDNQELRKLYSERCNSGQFECLVCSGIGGKQIKRYGDLVSLVMHASKILKTKRRPEHRGYGRAVCAVLGWDPLRTPTLPKGTNIRPRGCIPPPNETADTGIQLDGKDLVPADSICANVGGLLKNQLTT